MKIKVIKRVQLDDPKEKDDAKLKYFLRDKKKLIKYKKLFGIRQLTPMGKEAVNQKYGNTVDESILKKSLRQTASLGDKSNTSSMF